MSTGLLKTVWSLEENIANVTKHDGQSAHDYFYAPFGGIIDDNGKPEDSSNWTDPHNHYLLNGKEWDEETTHCGKVQITFKVTL